jgi:hypothetical protein
MAIGQPEWLVSRYSPSSPFVESWFQLSELHARVAGGSFSAHGVSMVVPTADTSVSKGYVDKLSETKGQPTR